MKRTMVALMYRTWISSLAPLAVAVLAFAALVLAPAPAVADQCDQLFNKYIGSNWWPGAFSNCRLTGTNRDAIFECAWKQVPAPENVQCLKDKLKASPITQKYVSDIVAFNSPPCDKLYAKYEGSSWWWGAFGKCKKRGGMTERNAIFECAWSQVPAPENTACLKDKLTSSPSTVKGFKEVAAYNSQKEPPTTTKPDSVKPDPVLSKCIIPGYTSVGSAPLCTDKSTAKLDAGGYYCIGPFGNRYVPDCTSKVNPRAEFRMQNGIACGCYTKN